MRCSVRRCARRARTHGAAFRSRANSPSAIAASMTVTPCGNDASAPEVRVADLAIAHYALRQSDGFSGRQQASYADSARGARASAGVVPQRSRCRVTHRDSPSRRVPRERPDRNASCQRSALAINVANPAGSSEAPPTRPAVDVRPRDVCGDVAGVHAPAVENRRIVQDPSTQPRIGRHDAIRIRRIAVRPRADRPDRFVRDHDPRELARVERRRRRRASAKRRARRFYRRPRSSRSRRPRRSASGLRAAPYALSS